MRVPENLLYLTNIESGLRSIVLSVLDVKYPHIFILRSLILRKVEEV
jgi:hypothetical protein